MAMMLNDFKMPKIRGGIRLMCPFENLHRPFMSNLTKFTSTLAFKFISSE